MRCIDICVKHTVCVLYLNQKKLYKPEQSGDNSNSCLMGQSKFCYEIAFWFISIENGGKQKVKIP